MTKSDDICYFGYIFWNGIVNPQKWWGIKTFSGVIQVTELTRDEEKLSLNELTETYPYNPVIE